MSPETVTRDAQNTLDYYTTMIPNLGKETNQIYSLLKVRTDSIIIKLSFLLDLVLDCRLGSLLIIVLAYL